MEIIAIIIVVFFVGLIVLPICIFKFSPKNTISKPKKLKNTNDFEFYIRPISTEIYCGQFTLNVEIKNRLQQTKIKLSREDFFIKNEDKRVNAYGFTKSKSMNFSITSLSNRLSVKPCKLIIVKVLFNTIEDGDYEFYFKGSKIELGKITKYKKNEIVYDETNNRGEFI